MHLMKLRYLTLSLFLALILGVWLSRAIIAEQLLTSLLGSYGLKEIAVDIGRVGLNESHFSHLGFSLATANGLFRLEIDEASLTYSPALLRRGRVRDLLVERLSAAYKVSRSNPALQSTPSEPLEPFVIIAALRRGLREYVIFDSFLVQHAALRGDAFGPVQDRPLRLSGTNSSTGTSVRVGTLHTEPQNLATGAQEVAVLQLSENRIAAKLLDPANPLKKTATVELAIDDTRIEGAYAIALDGLRRWFQTYTDAPDAAVTGSIDGRLGISQAPGDRIKARVTAAAPSLSAGDHSANTLHVQLNLDLPHRYPFDAVKLEPDSLIKAGRLDIYGVSLGDMQLKLSGDLLVADGGWQYAGAVIADALTVKYASREIALESIHAQISADPELLEVEGEFAPATLPGRFGYALSHRLLGHTGSLSVTPLEAIDLNAGDYRLSQLMTPWPYSFDILTGILELSADAAWSRSHAFSLTTTSRLENTGGYFDELVFSGLSSEHGLEILPELKSKRPGSVTIEHLDSGVAASKISSRLTFLPADSGTLPRLEIRDLHGEIFGGTFAGDDFVLDLNAKKNRFRITAQNIDLAQIVETQQLEDIAVTGKVDGILPVEINEDGLSIENGAFVNNVRAGTIRYRPVSGTDQLQQNPLTGIALDALRDFRYSHLSAEVNFTHEGVLTVNLKLQGTSPELETSRPVHLNINTEQNLLSLLKSLRYAEGISAKIDSKVRRKYQNQQ